jgi:hypothetical protein
MAFDFNPNDPRYQRELQKARAKRSMGGPVRGVQAAVEGEIGAKHAAYQMGRQMEFQRLGLQSELAKNQLDRFKDRLALDKDKLSWRRGAFNDELKDRRLAENIGIVTGLLGAGYSAYEGSRREKLLRKQLELEEARLQEYEDAIFDKQQRQGTLPNIPGWR